jgi:hypothetical protein
MIMNDILELKDTLLNPKRSDEFVVPFYLMGWRYCSVKIGSKNCTVQPITGGKPTKYTPRRIKEELCNTYWYAAKCHASRDGKRKKNWESAYA